MVLAWIASWSPQHPLSSLSFFLLWVGFIFTLDGIAYMRRGTSFWQNHPRKFLQMFVFSIPFWWLFEFLNYRVQNWHYILDKPFGIPYNNVMFNVLATLCFSTVLPAVMEVSAIITSFPAFKPKLGPKDSEPFVPHQWVALQFILGVIGISAALIWPHYAFGLIWLGPLLILDSVNVVLGNRSALGHLIAGDFKFLIAIPFATLITGFFWEMWNYWSLPKWYYTVPFVGFAKIFEMPALGFTGYLPFGLELFALYQLLLWMTRQHEDVLPF